MKNMFILVSYILLQFLMSIKLLRTDQLKSSPLFRFTVFLVLGIYAVILHYHLLPQKHRLVHSSIVHEITRDATLFCRDVRENHLWGFSRSKNRMKISLVNMADHSTADCVWKRYSGNYPVQISINYAAVLVESAVTSTVSFGIIPNNLSEKENNN